MSTAQPSPLPSYSAIFSGRNLARRLQTSVGPVRITFVAVPGLSRPVFAYAIGKKVGKAVVRNKVRRRLREIVRELDSELAPGGYLVVCSPGIKDLTFPELRSRVQTAINQISIKVKGAK